MIQGKATRSTGGQLSAFIIICIVCAPLSIDLCLGRWPSPKKFLRFEKRRMYSMCIARVASIAGMLFCIAIICAFLLRRHITKFVRVSFMLLVVAIEAALLSQSFLIWSVARGIGTVAKSVQWLPTICSAVCAVASLALSLYAVLATPDQWSGITLTIVNTIGELVNSAVGIIALSPNVQCAKHTVPKPYCPLCWWIAIRAKPEAVAAIACRPLTVSLLAIWSIRHITSLRSSRLEDISTLLLFQASHVLLSSLLTEGWGCAFRVFLYVREQSSRKERNGLQRVYSEESHTPHSSLPNMSREGDDRKLDGGPVVGT